MERKRLKIIGARFFRRRSDAYLGNPGFGDGSDAIQAAERWGRRQLIGRRRHRTEIDMNGKIPQGDPGFAEAKG